MKILKTNLKLYKRYFYIYQLYTYCLIRDLLCKASRIRLNPIRIISPTPKYQLSVEFKRKAIIRCINIQHHYRSVEDITETNHYNIDATLQDIADRLNRLGIEFKVYL